MEEREYGSNITLETRKESYDEVEKTSKQKRYTQILEIMNIYNEPMTAKEIAVKMYEYGCSYTDERNITAPRINELLKVGKLDVVGKIKCQYSGKKVSCFVIRKEGN